MSLGGFFPTSASQLYSHGTLVDLRYSSIECDWSFFVTCKGKEKSEGKRNIAHMPSPPSHQLKKGNLWLMLLVTGLLADSKRWRQVSESHDSQSSCGAHPRIIAYNIQATM